MITSTIDWNTITLGSILIGISKENLNPNYEYIDLSREDYVVRFLDNPELYQQLRLPIKNGTKVIPKIENAINMWMVVNYK